MPTLAFEGNLLGPPVTVEAQGGGRLVDLCDDARAPVAFSCRSARCSTCLVEIVAGQALLEPPRPDERELLATLADAPARRLACQAVVRAGPGLIRLRWAAGPP